MFRIQLVNL
ncbi:hypothetical protein F383_37768 [Gossypium arboreum]|uniref:Uncharacterized protein n=1 Tax=Gossypium arboreum TaxID=29729 RepID=A0A0B0MD46_GOSAR|nr:hypothetical protein F383_37768 [Gossypium arboreum]